MSETFRSDFWKSKKFDQTISKNINLQNDNELLLFAAFREKLVLYPYIRIYSAVAGTSPGLRYTFAIPQGAVLYHVKEMGVGKQEYPFPAPNGNVYVCVSNGDIYMQTEGTGDFVALGQVVRHWYSMTAAPNGNVYACVYNGDIYMQAGGTGDFIALGQVARNWQSMAAAPNGDVYVCVYAGDIYMNPY